MLDLTTGSEFAFAAIKRIRIGCARSLLEYRVPESQLI